MAFSLPDLSIGYGARWYDFNQKSDQFSPIHQSRRFKGGALSVLIVETLQQILARWRERQTRSKRA